MRSYHPSAGASFVSFFSGELWIIERGEGLGSQPVVFPASGGRGKLYTGRGWK